MYKDPNYRRELIMKHYMKPLLKKQSDEKETIYYHSNQCVDEVKIYLTIENDVVKDVFWDGQGCAVFQSSTDIFLSMIKDKDINYVNTLIENYEALINRVGSYDENILGDLMVYFNVGEHLNRAVCAKMVSDAMKQLGGK